MSTQELVGEPRLIVYTLSDASGQTAEMVVKAVVSQFQGQAVRIVRLPRVVSPAQLVNMVKLAAQGPCLLAFTLVRDDLRATLTEEAARYDVPTVDLLGALIGSVARMLGAEPLHEAGLVHTKDEDYFRRMDAIDFAIKYDDGKSPQGLLRADLVLVGVSRTSKTPTSIYLAHRGVRSANVPLVPGAEPPPQLFQVKRPLVVGLTVSPDRLVAIRRNRLLSLKQDRESDYVEMEAVREETVRARRLFEKHGWPVIDVTRRSVEETAAAVINLLSARKGEAIPA